MKNFKFKPVLWSFLTILSAMLIWFCAKSPKEQGIADSAGGLSPASPYEIFLANGATASIAPNSQLNGSGGTEGQKCNWGFTPLQTITTPNLTWQLDIVETSVPNPNATPAITVASFKSSYGNNAGVGGIPLPFGQLGNYPVKAGKYYWYFASVHQLQGLPTEQLSSFVGNSCQGYDLWAVSHHDVLASNLTVFGHKAYCSFPACE